MAFKDNPKSDKYAKNCEDSVLAFKRLFTQRKGFITRSEFPDFGVDENIELLYYNGKEYSGASNKYFAVQLKSINEVKTHITKDNKEYIKLSFETSRLGYLLRNPPAHGIIVLYDVKKEILYYEYAEEIYSYLKDKHNGDCWKQKRSIVIHININNVLNSETVKEIHTKMLLKHQNINLCINAFGADYGIKVYDDELIDEQLDFNNPKVILNQLKRNGWKLIHSNDFNIIFEMLDRVLQKDILSSNSVTTIAAISYCESGQFIESKFYFQKYFQRFDSSDEFYDSVKFIKFKVEFALGNLDFKEYSKLLSEISKNSKGSYNQIIVKINLLYINLIVDMNNRCCDDSKIKDIMSIVKAIKDSSLSESSKFYLSSYNISNIQIYYTSFITHTVGGYKVKKSINKPINKSEVLQFLNKKKLLEKLLLSTLSNTYHIAEKEEDDFLKAQCLKELSSFFFLKNLNSVMMDEEILLPFDTSKELFEEKINQAFTASSSYEKIGRFKDAYSSLCLTYELTSLYYHKQGEVILNELPVLYALIEKFASSYGFEPYKSEVDDYFQMKNTGIVLTDEILENYADIFINQLKLPVDRKVHVLSNLKSIELFKQHKRSNEFNLLEDLGHTISLKTHFKEASTFFIQCKKCLEETNPSKDLKELIPFMDNHSC